MLENVITANTSIFVYHLAAIVSNHAEDDFDLGWKVNTDLTRQLLEEGIVVGNRRKFVLSSLSEALACRLWRYALPDTSPIPPRSRRARLMARGAACELCWSATIPARLCGWWRCVCRRSVFARVSKPRRLFFCQRDYL